MIISQPSHLGLFILWHSKKRMNDVILPLDGSKNNKLYYSDTDSKYIHSDEYEILKTKGLIGEDIYQSKNDFEKEEVYIVQF